jgi:acetyl-CoA synthetase
VTDGAPITSLDEREAKAVLAAAGISVPRNWEASFGEPIPSDIPSGGRFVVKLLSRSLLHKSDLGAVKVGVGRDCIAAAMATMQQSIPAALGHDGRYLVEEFVPGQVAELLIGITRVSPIGLVLTIASGGVLAELGSDRAVVLLPASHDDIESALVSLRVDELIAGYRGRPKGDRAAAVAAIRALVAFAMAEADRLVEVEINPLLVLADGKGAVAVDAVMQRLT